jgi:hypothetical protein
LDTVNVTDCDEVKDQYDQFSNYINTVCLVSLKKNYENADAKCQSQGMFLYNVDVPEVEKALLDFSNSLFRPSLGEALFIDGKRSEGCAAVANKEGLFGLSFIDCSEKHYFYCQFTRTPKTEKLGDHETMEEKTTITIKECSLVFYVKLLTFRRHLL